MTMADASHGRKQLRRYIVADGYWKQSKLITRGETNNFTTRLDCLELEEL
jgi:hypothetical protein